MTATNKLLAALAIGLMIFVPVLAMDIDGDSNATDGAYASNGIPKDKDLPFEFEVRQYEPKEGGMYKCFYITGFKDDYELKSKTLEIPALVYSTQEDNYLKVVGITEGAFAGKDMHGARLVLPNTIEYIGDGAFYDTYILRIEFNSQSIPEMGYRCFYYNLLNGPQPKPEPELESIVLSGPSWVQKILVERPDQEYFNYSEFDVKMAEPHKAPPMFTTEQIIGAICVVCAVLFVSWVAIKRK